MARRAAGGLMLLTGLLGGQLPGAAAASAAPSRTAAGVTAAAGAPYVAVKGNHLVNAAGHTIRLLGVDRSGSEYECMYSSAVFDGPSDATSIKAMAAWHIDAVRLPLNEDCWLGIDGAQRFSTAARYRAAIEGYVQRLQAQHLLVILDLHWAAPGSYPATSQWPMADASHAPAFWASVAHTFRTDHGLLFDLFNEPYVTSWTCWLHGCRTSYDDNGTTVAYQTAGMQQLVDAVRGAHADQPLMLGGLGYSSDESGWKAHEPRDPDHQLVVSFHTYNFSGCDTAACWNSTIAPLARSVPVVTGEVGQSGCTDGYVDTYMPWADAHGVSYLAWTWDSTGPPSDWSCSNGPALITDYQGEPTGYGTGVKRHLAQLAAAGR